MKHKFLSSRFPFFFDDEFDMDFPSYCSGLSVYEDEKHVYVEASLPGLNRDHIEISMDHNILTIEGEKKEELDEKKYKFHSKSKSAYSYRISVPGNIDEKKQPEATFNNGVVKIIFNKVEGKKAQKIPIK